MPTDEEILGALRAGELDESMRTLARAYGGGLYGFALGGWETRGLAEEVVQEVMVRVWRNAARFNPRRGTLKAWVYEMAGNLVIDAHRRRAVRPALASLDAADQAGAATKPIRSSARSCAGRCRRSSPSCGPSTATSSASSTSRACR